MFLKRANRTPSKYERKNLYIYIDTGIEVNKAENG